jgi:hypothetical protein
MKPVRILAAAGAPVALAAVLAGPALAASSPKVTFRVEGKSKTLLKTKTVKTPSGGSITKGGAPPGRCPAGGTAAGAFNVATKGKWTGKAFSFGLEVNSIFGESVNNKTRYWELFINDHVAPKGICDLKVKGGDQLLFANVSAKATEYPIQLSVPTEAKVGKSFRVQAFYFPGKGSKTKPMAGVKLSGVKGTTNAKGMVTVTPSKAGRLSITGAKQNEIRSAASVVAVSK